MKFYKSFIRPGLFKTDPERIHNITLRCLQLTSNLVVSKKILTRFSRYSQSILSQKLWGLDFLNPIGLAAGFDKNCVAPRAYPMLGFGWAEIGSVTAKAQSGNSKPRLWRLPEHQSTIVYYGLANQGADIVSHRLKRFGQQHPDYPLGVSIAKTTCASDDKTIADYLESFQAVCPHAKFVSINISCPNVPAFEPDKIDTGFINKLLSAIQTDRLKQTAQKPLMIKISPDYSQSKLHKIIDIAVKNKIEAVIATNLTKKRESLNLADPKYQKMPGGISGKLLQSKSDQVISHIYQYAGDKIKIVGCGGIFTAEDAYRKIRLGASLLQLITGLVYNGPLAIRNINQGLAELLKQDGFENISQAVGTNSLRH